MPPRFRSVLCTPPALVRQSGRLSKLCNWRQALLIDFARVLLSNGLAIAPAGDASKACASTSEKRFYVGLEASRTDVPVSVRLNASVKLSNKRCSLAGVWEAA